VLAAERDDDHTLRSVLDEARATGNLEVQVFALDALARLAAESHDRENSGDLLAESDRLAAEVAHVVDESDRIDAAAALKIRWKYSTTTRSRIVFSQGAVERSGRQCRRLQRGTVEVVPDLVGLEWRSPA